MVSAMQEVEISLSDAGPVKKEMETLPGKETKPKRPAGGAQVAECLSSKLQGLEFNSPQNRVFCSS
jgi:ribosomal protein L34E